MVSAAVDAIAWPAGAEPAATEGRAPEGETMTRDDLLAIAAEPNVAAFLRAIRLGEGTRDADGYRRIVGGALATSLADHPRRSVFLPRYGVHSTAAGAYQFLARTWDEIRAQYGFPSFAPQWQDAGAVALLIRRGALDAVREGDVRRAVDLCRLEWASLPGSPYGQRTESMSAFLAEYLRHGGVIAGPVGDAPRPKGWLAGVWAKLKGTA